MSSSDKDRERDIGFDREDDKWGLHTASDEGAPEIASLMALTGYFDTSSPNEEFLDAEFLEIAGPEVLEIHPTGETGYKTAMSLSRLALWVHELVEKIDSDRERENNENKGNKGNKENKEAEVLVRGSSSASSSSSHGDVSVNADQTDDTAGTTGGSESEGENNEEIEGTERIKEIEVEVAPEDLAASVPVRELQFHDLRYMKIQTDTHEEPMILVRKHAVIITLSPLRAIVTADRVILSVPEGADGLLYILHDYLSEGVTATPDEHEDTPTPELRAYKALLSTAIAIHRKEYDAVCLRVDVALDKTKTIKRISPALREEIRVLKIGVDKQSISISGYQMIFSDLLLSEEDLALMNLTLLKRSPHLCTRPVSPELLRNHSEIKDLIGSQLKAYKGIGTRLDFLQMQIQNTNKLVSIRLNTFQNDLIIVQVMLDCFMVAIGAGGLLAGMFCTNLYYTTSTSVFDFWFISAMLLVTIGLMFFVIERRLKGYGIAILENSNSPMKSL